MFMKKNATTQFPIAPLLAERWSGRAYDSRRLLGAKETIVLLEAARWAPSCMGDQPWRVLVMNKATHPEVWEKGFECLSEGNQSWVRHAPWLALICADTLFSKNGEPNRWAEYDVGAAALSICLQATSLGMMAHQLGGFDQVKARAIFNIPSRFQLMSFICVGYPVAEEEIPEALVEREKAPRVRRPLGELFFDAQWDTPVVSG
jgi:nitroreductase